MSKTSVAVSPVEELFASPEFPAKETVEKIRGMADHLAISKTEVAEAERGLALAVKNRDLLELTGSNPDEVIRKAKDAVDLKRRQLSAAKNDLTRALVAARDEAERMRSASWARVYSDIVKPRAAKVASVIEAFESIADEIVALLNPESETIRHLDTLDAATDRWNSFVSEVSGPGNAILNAAAGSKALRSSLTQSVNLRRFEAALTKIKEALNPRPATRPPLTEEQFVAEQTRAAENARVLADHQRADCENLLNRDKTLLQSTK